MPCTQPSRGPGPALFVGLACAALTACLPKAPLVVDDDLIRPAPRPGTAEHAPGVPEPKQPPAPPDGPLTLHAIDAILLAVQNNKALAVQRLNPPIVRTFEDQERAVFDPTVDAEVSADRTRTERPKRDRADSNDSDSSTTGAAAGVDPALARVLGATTTAERTDTDDKDRAVAEGRRGSVRLRQFLPTGTTAEIEATTDLDKSSLYTDKAATSSLGLSVTQALLQGRGVAVNLASLRQARLDTRISQYELRGFAEALVAEVEQTYWDYGLAERQIEIFAQSVKLAEQQLNDTQERIRIGRLAETELAAARAEVALRREALINAHSALAQTHLRLLRLLNPPGPGLWQRQISLLAQPTAPGAALDDVEQHVQVALRMRPDLNEAKLRVRSGALEVVKTRNGLLPRLDLFVTLGKTGYARSFGTSTGDLDGKSYDLAAGLSLEYPLGNRDPRARHGRAVLSHRQAAQAVDNLAQLVQVDVRSAHIEVGRAREQVAATAATRKLKEEALRAETGKFTVGKSTSFLVAQAQRDLVVSQIAEIGAVVTLLKGLVELYRLEGSLLERRGIAAPGHDSAAPVGPRR